MDAFDPPAPDAAASQPRRACTILVVDDHELVRLGVRALLQAQPSPAAAGLQVLEAESLAQALALYARHVGTGQTIDLVLLDLALPDTQGLSGLATFRERFPQARIVALSGTGMSAFSQNAIAQSALALGARAFLPKSANLREVVSFIRACGLLGSGVVDGQADKPAPAAKPAPAPASRGWQQLKPHQAQVLRLVLEGKTNREIAQITSLAEGTVKNYVSTILLLFGMRSRAQLISSLR
ncbi:response regulator transcription factor [Xenophilus arseniciresistens]|uniref:Response regulator transcription factor n=1 Tax=Xenophilus arseniciresistens TaxID=1283306 RepID=A0AAE3N6B4_9BURK|nr:response regulator transcription factor [Xenophilus arseniciresistens]MDA7415363.1 response regulator transcription factor [Xenophilus arseniciresistens]